MKESGSMNEFLQTTPAGSRAARGGRKLLLVLAALFALPIAVAAALLAFGWRPTQGGPHGELMVAVEPLPFDGLRGADGQPLPSALLAGKWTLLIADAGPCGTECQSRIDTVRRIHVALNKQMPRIRRVWLSPDPAHEAQLPALKTSYPDLVIAAPASPGWQALLAEPGARLIVIDPSGRTVLRFREPIDAKGALKDVERLLRYSWLG
jgi:cytochrome oxidase Cu insertion factor (SCO1/SenC/PrrC family)